MLAAGGPAAGLYEIPGLSSAFRSLAEGIANQPEEGLVLPMQTGDESEEELVLPAQTGEVRDASQEVSEKEKTPSEPQGETENVEVPALGSGSSAPELASVEPAPEAQHVIQAPASPLTSSTQPKATPSYGSGTSTSSTSPTRAGGTKGGSPPAKNIAEQSQPKSPRQNSSQKTSGNSAQLTEFSKNEAANREEAQEEREEAREQAEEQAEEAAEEHEEAREEIKERLK
jgi:hypothetical protein